MTTHRRFSRAGALVLLVAALLLGHATPASAQQPPNGGLVGAALRLRQLDGVKRVLMIGAHPDDEDSALLAAMARGMGIETAYLSLTRGDGGQNLIGPELSEGLGVIRTGELVAARSIDGGKQFFTRALDYGFSKNAEEAFSHWPKEQVLGDVVWVIRTFRPQVIVSVFTGTPADGHGHHQVAGILTPEAFAAAADPKRFPEQLAYVRPWQADKLFRISRRDPAGTPLTVVQTGVFDPLLGRSWSQVALEGRSQHRSQGQGRAQPPGPFASQLVLLKSMKPVAPGAGLLAGVDTSLIDLASQLPAQGRAGAIQHVQAYRAAIAQAEDQLGVKDPGAVVPQLSRALRELDALAATAGPAGPRGTDFAIAIAHHVDVGRAALLAVAGIVVDASVPDAQLVPGAQTTVTIRAWNGGRMTVTGVRPELRLPRGWAELPGEAVQTARGNGPGGAASAQSRSPEEVAKSGRIDPGEVATWTFRVRVPADASPNDPYFMRLPREGDLFRWPDDRSVWGLPFDPPLIQAGASLQVDSGAGQTSPTIASIGEAPFLGATPANGEYREPALLTPALSVTLDHPTMGWPLADRQPREVAVRLESEAAEGVRGNVHLEAPAGWTVEPTSVPFIVERRGSTMSATFRVRPPATDVSGKVTFRAVAEAASGGSRWDRSIMMIDYPHIRRAFYVMPAELTVTRVPVQVAQGRRVGYIMGTGDGGLEALRQMGADVVELTPQRMQAGDFSGLDVIVVGVRAYEVRPDVIAANARLLAFARAGGTLIVQYQQSQNPSGGFTPYPLAINVLDRVTDEKAPVTVLDATAPVFTTPNRIDPADFDGWAQERGTYFPETWDDRYTPLLEMHDPGEAPQKGSLLVAPLDKGLYVYSTVAFFRQFPQAVPGAYRLFANLVSLDAQSWARHVADGVR